MRRGIQKALVVSLAVFLLTACSGKEEHPEPVSTAFSEAAGVEETSVIEETAEKEEPTASSGGTLFPGAEGFCEMSVGTCVDGKQVCLGKVKLPANYYALPTYTDENGEDRYFDEVSPTVHPVSELIESVDKAEQYTSGITGGDPAGSCMFNITVEPRTLAEYRGAYANRYELIDTKVADGREALIIGVDEDKCSLVVCLDDRNCLFITYLSDLVKDLGYQKVGELLKEVPVL